ncbi:MAG: hypothetical protein EA397_11225 [Deltaproteobacteria bacterium]|nr:MAG: hypothetical protein EA397_11225 [Deltaproteobacteria bacterium]
MKKWILISATAMFACGGEDNGSDSDSSDNGFDSNRTSVLDLIEPDLDACVEFETSEGLICRDIEGAERYFAADVNFLDDDEIGGRFYVVLFANAAWRETSDWQNSDAADDEMCVVAFSLTGTRRDGGGDACGACDLTLTYNIGNVDVSMTTCPQDYVNDVANDAVGISDAYWGVDRRSDGTAIGYDTARAWAPNGEHYNGGVSLWSNLSCEWYGSGECT